MNITYQKATETDIEPVCDLCRRLIHDYEDLESIDYPKVMQWVRQKLETSIGEYTAIYADGQKAGYYHFHKNENGVYELDDLYIFPPFQNRGIGTAVVRKCCVSVDSQVMLYVFIKNERAVALYRRLGFAVTEMVGGSRYIMHYRRLR